MENTNEKWLPVPGWEGLYEVSNHGRVKSLPRLRSDGHHHTKERILKPKPAGKGYLSVCLSYGRIEYCYVHALVLAAFIGPCPDGHLCRHRDDNGKNNHLSNLLYGTYRDNADDAISNGRIVLGERRRNSKLTVEKVQQIRAAVEFGYREEAIALEYGVSRRLLNRISIGEAWKHAGGPLRQKRKSSKRSSIAAAT